MAEDSEEVGRGIPALVRPDFTLSFNDCKKCLCVRVVGTWSDATVEAYKDALAVHTVEARKRYGRAVLVADLRQSPVQPAHVAEELSSAGKFFRPNEKLAIIVEQALMKMQMKRVSSHPAPQEFFFCEDEAFSWIEV